MSLLLTLSIILHTAFAHFCRPLLEGAGIFVLRNIFLTLLGPMGVILSPIFSPTLAVAGFLPGFVLSLHSGYTSAIRTDSDHKLPFLSNIAFSQNTTGRACLLVLVKNLIQHVPKPSLNIFYCQI